jgi:zinc protease
MEILGGSETSRLYRALVEEQRIAVSAGASGDTAGRGGGGVTVFASPVEGVSLETLEAAMDQVIADFLRDGPTEAELARAKSRLAAAAIYARDSQESLANIYGSSLAEGETLDAIVAWPERIEEVTREEALAISRATLDLNDSVTGWLMPPEESE